MVVKVHCGTVLREAFSTWRQIRPPKQCTLTTISPGLPRNLNVANYEVAEETGLNFVHKAIPQCNLTPRTNNRSGVTLKGFPEPERVLYEKNDGVRVDGTAPDLLKCNFFIS